MTPSAAFSRALALMLCLAFAAPSWAKPAIWTVQGPRGRIVLFGSFHQLPPGLDWRPPQLDQALTQADSLWFETDLDAVADVATDRLFDRAGRPGAPGRLWGDLTIDQRQRVETAAARLNLDLDSLSRLPPWRADLMLELALDARSGVRSGEGVEARLQAEAPPRLRRRALESVREQVSFLSGGATTDQVASLDLTARQALDDPDIDLRILNEWMTGDLAGLDRDALEPLARIAPAAHRRLVTDRNHRWARRLEALARRPGLAVVVVGAGHLTGPEGLPALLRARGLRVDGP